MSDLSITVAELEKRLGTALEVEPIQKGFSSDKKYVVNTRAETFLLRVSAADWKQRKWKKHETAGILTRLRGITARYDYFLNWRPK